MLVSCHQQQPQSLLIQRPYVSIDNRKSSLSTKAEIQLTGSPRVPVNVR
jgi:hypothetical protein